MEKEMYLILSSSESQIGAGTIITWKLDEIKDHGHNTDEYFVITKNGETFLGYDLILVYGKII